MSVKIAKNNKYTVAKALGKHFLNIGLKLTH